MAQFRKPFYKKSHKAWYVQLDGRQVRLGETEDAAFERYHELMRQKKQADRVRPDGPPPVTLGTLVQTFLAAGFHGKSPETRAWYGQRLTPFLAHLGAGFVVTELKPTHVDGWVAAHPAWAAGTVRNCWRAVQRCCRWGHRRGMIPELALLHQEKPRGGRREVVISPAEYNQLLGYVRNDEFRALVVVAWETGCRPQDVLRAQGRHLDPAQKRLVFQTQESKDKSHPRVVYFTDAAWDALGTRAHAVGSRHLFTNSDGLPWTTDAVNCAFGALHRRMRAAGIECRRYCLYHLRHSWLDRMLKSGVDALTCAILMGHKDPSQLARTYQHLSRSPDYLRAALNAPTRPAVP